MVTAINIQVTAPEVRGSCQVERILGINLQQEIVVARLLRNVHASEMRSVDKSCILV